MELRSDSKTRSIRVFVSSTFRDMMAEREELVKRVFPQLRKLCEQRGVTWGEVDLQWGVTDEQRAEGKVLPIYLAEIPRPALLHRTSGRALRLGSRRDPRGAYRARALAQGAREPLGNRA